MATDRLYSMSRVSGRKRKVQPQPQRGQSGYARNFDLLMEAQRYWNAMDRFRRDRERNKRYTYGDQWGDMVEVDGCRMTEEAYIRKQGRVPLKNNLIRRLVRTVTGVYRSQSKEPTCTARDRDEQQYGETMSTVLQCNMQRNKAKEVYARTVEDYLIGGFAVHKKWYGWRNGTLDCWTDYIQPNNFFIDNNMRDFRGWDVGFLGEVHDVGFGQLCEQLAASPSDWARLKEIYRYAHDGEYMGSFAESFGYSRGRDYSFLVTSEPGRCRVIEIWRKEQKPRIRCIDPQNGDVYKIETDEIGEIRRINAERRRLGAEQGMQDEDIPLIETEWFVDDRWMYYYLSPFGDILKCGETPYEHGGHPYVFKAYPFIDGEIHSFVADVIDQQRYTNRLITMYDWIMRASAKGVLLMPDDCLPDGVSMEDIAESWTEFNGVIVFRPSKSGQLPQQVANNSTNIGIAELLNVQLKFFEDISGVNAAMQGKPGFSGMSAALDRQNQQNATVALLDILESFSTFVLDAAYKDVKNMQQFYDTKRVFNIAGRAGKIVEYDPEKIRDVDFDLSITENTDTPVYRQMANDVLMQLFNAQAINVEMLLENGDFPFADSLLQSIKSNREAVQQGVQPQPLPQDAVRQAQDGTDMGAVNRLYDAMRGDAV